eukprot:403332969
MLRRQQQQTNFSSSQSYSGAGDESSNRSQLQGQNVNNQSNRQSNQGDLSSQSQQLQPSNTKVLIKKFRRCCCHHAPAVIILDIIIILILIGEIILIQDTQLELDNSNIDSVQVPVFNYTFTYGNQTYNNKNGFPSQNQNYTNTTNITNQILKTSLWEISSSSVIIIPLNSFFIALGLRLLFCKIQLEIMKFSLIALLFMLYVSSMIGLTLYSSQSNTDLFKQNFFLQYIIMTISLVLGILTEVIAMLMMAYYFMKVMQVQIKKVSHLFLLEKQEALLGKQQQQIAQQNQQQAQNQDQGQQEQQQNQNINSQLQGINNPISGIVRALTNNTNYNAQRIAKYKIKSKFCQKFLIVKQKAKLATEIRETLVEKQSELKQQQIVKYITYEFCKQICHEWDLRLIKLTLKQEQRQQKQRLIWMTIAVKQTITRRDRPHKQRQIKQQFLHIPRSKKKQIALIQFIPNKCESKHDKIRFKQLKVLKFRYRLEFKFNMLLHLYTSINQQHSQNAKL